MTHLTHETLHIKTVEKRGRPTGGSLPEDGWMLIRRVGYTVFV
jgi:hypothetical protein